MKHQTVTINGQTYKIGLNGWVFVHRFNEWVRSMEYSAADIIMKIKSRDRGDDRKKSDVKKKKG